MTIYVDADSCPVKVREIVCRAAGRREIQSIFVAARTIPLPQSKYVSLVEVESGPDAADNEILARVGSKDMVITRDIPLAALLVERGVLVLNDRGDVYTSENIRPRLSERDFMAELRSMGLESMKDRSYGQKELQAFASAFDRELTRKVSQ